MSNEPEDELSEAERRALRGDRSERQPPAELEARVVAALRERGLLSDGRTGRPGWLRVAAGLAASVLIFLAGAVTGSRFGVPDVPSPPASPGEQFVLLLYEGSDFRDALPGREGERVAEYVAWARRLGESGHRIGGEKLKNEEEILGLPIPGSPVAGPSAGGLGRLGGYFVLQAKSLEEARGLASSCPHLRYAGRIVIRPIDPD